MSDLMTAVYPHIACHPQIANGAPVIEGTRITIRCLAGYYQMGMSVDEILQTLAHLTASQVMAGLAYYFDHQSEIDEDLTQASDVGRWQREALPHPKSMPDAL
jgi:uncharacterized protein (DUF433 family)